MIQHTFNERIIEKLVTIITEHKQKIMANWLETIYLLKDDPFYDEIVLNAESTITFILKYLKEDDEDYVIHLTRKIAIERIQAGVNINELVNNINVGRTIINRLIIDSDLDEQEKLEGMVLVDQVFHKFLYYAVKEYTELKDKIIREKNLFIQEMHTDRLSILGQIAASFAHEFRNPLTSIKGFLKLLTQKYKNDEQAKYYFEIVDNEVESLEGKLSQFLYLSKVRGLDDEMNVVNLNDIVQDMVNFLYPKFLEETIEVVIELNEDCYIEAVEDQIKQILLNILTNAVEELASLASSRLIRISVFTKGDSGVLEIANNGTKIPDYLESNIFEPFVTTKDVGTGLGLSVCKQIVEKHNGSLQVDSQEDWTTFLIKFPLTKVY
ncbi:histidine kinase N-terminal domain-containing protein [Bacillus solimangrovi]|uniref:histidine kinase n=1 Tax=Bacillus solimangrovi TaxID=1305675 RepID=A0A1E5LC66_9BACI|nr:histidine kinase N-terminal domain-containing protein [Bacillus solimangrovi]OEH91657.1 hypothetical protein BFG57_04605 [Bacillus solimangrovi]